MENEWKQEPVAEEELDSVSGGAYPPYYRHMTTCSKCGSKDAEQIGAWVECYSCGRRYCAYYIQA